MDSEQLAEHAEDVTTPQNGADNDQRRSVRALFWADLEQPERCLTLLTGYIADIFGCVCRCFGPGWPPRAKTVEFLRAAVEQAEVDIGESEQPVSVFEFADSNGAPGRAVR